MYYIYELWNPKTSEPIYIGYGKHNRNKSTPRYKDHLHEAMLYKNNKIKNIKKLNLYKIHVLLQMIEQGIEIEYRFPYENLSYEDVCDKEKELIKLYGRRCENTGPLTNLDSGGRGGKELSTETKRKIGDSNKGKESPLKGKVLGKYDDSRKKSIREGILSFNKSEKSEASRKAISEKLKGKSPWNKGKTKETDIRVAKYSEAKKGISRPDMIGHIPWNKGKTKETDNMLKRMSESKKGSISPNRGIPSGNKGKTYEEIYGEQVAKNMKDCRKNTAWINDGTSNKKIKLFELQTYIEDGWVRGRIMHNTNKKLSHNE